MKNTDEELSAEELADAVLEVQELLAGHALPIPPESGIAAMTARLSLLGRQKARLLEGLAEAWSPPALAHLEEVNREISMARLRLAEYQVQTARN